MSESAPSSSMPTGCKPARHARPVDRRCSWYLPAQGRDAKAEYEAAHIPGAHLLRPGCRRRSRLDLPHTLPGRRTFARHVGAMGISADDTIVVYDGPGVFSAPRVWWMFRIMGVFQVYRARRRPRPLEGAGRPVTAEPTKVAPMRLSCRSRPSRVASLDDMSASRSGESQIADARPAGRFAGGEPGAAAGRARRPHARREKPAGRQRCRRRQAAAAG